ncbi:MAG: DSD1 family PLP-dependent enzyme [Clostridia bacterium]
MKAAPLATPGQRLEEVDTPALVVDLDALETNLDTLRDALRGRAVRVRPHAKTHKSADIARLQIARGAVGVCCQKVSEAEALVAQGIDDILVSNEVVGAPKLARLAQLSRRARIGVCVDNAENLADLASLGAQLDVYVEIDVGMGRCGIGAGEPAAELAAQVARVPHLRFAGLQAYHGRAQHVRSLEERRSIVASVAGKVRETKEAIKKRKLDCQTVTGAGSGTFMFEAESGAWDEIQPGSYVFMDVDYGRNEWAAPMPRFRNALFVLSTVMSRPSPGLAILDAGLKASSVDSGMPVVWQRPGLEYEKASDEHGVVRVAEGEKVALGEKLLLVPGHCDPTVNLYDWYVCVRKGLVEALWPVTARGMLA